ncbi:SigE family RNA polymerase sigma factor [Nonomuraea sp. B12E4]|uniref:SigE family RNA polymerase sigma factor n=1 Tax=Nonomuraea sp. B12E4 TaxID=3153564 RepID=UPI00325CC582
MATTLDEEFTRYVKTTRPTLRRMAFRLSSDWYEADDLVQRTLIAIYRRWELLHSHDKMARYTYAIMTRLLISDRRAHRWSREVLYDLPPEPPPLPDPYRPLDDRLRLLDALAGLAPRQRTAVVLRYWEDRSVEETARVMGSSCSTVRSQTVRALAALRSALEGGQEEEPPATPPLEQADGEPQGKAPGKGEGPVCHCQHGIAS